MSSLSLKVVSKEGIVKKEKVGSERVHIEFFEEYQLGDQIIVTIEKSEAYLMVQLDEALAPSLLYIKGNEWVYEVPIDEKLREAYSPKVFSGNIHYIWVRYADATEIYNYQNLAINTHDQKHINGAYPHAVANVETRNESTFYARNAIDGCLANESHGSYPYQSWGINQQKDAEITIEFGRIVEIDKIALVLRGDYPHDSYWKEVTLELSNGEKFVLELKKILEPQYFSFKPEKVEWVRLKNLVKNEDESPFPALTEFEVYGKNV